jgi:hypothetical protein
MTPEERNLEMAQAQIADLEDRIEADKEYHREAAARQAAGKRADKHDRDLHALQHLQTHGDFVLDPGCGPDQYVWLQARGNIIYGPLKGGRGFGAMCARPAPIIQETLRARGWSKLAVGTFVSGMHQVAGSINDYAHHEQLFVPYRGAIAYNAYVPSKITPTALSPTELTRTLEPVKRLLSSIVGAHDIGGVSWLTAWLARGVQQLAAKAPRKIGVAVTTYGAEGVGKGILTRMMQQIYGDSNVAVLGQDAITERYTTAIEGKLFIVANEISMTGPDARKVANKLKAWITDRTIPARDMYAPAGMIADSVFQLMINSNDEAPALLGTTDRRYTIFNSNVPLDKSLGKQLGEDADTCGPLTRALYQYLLEYKSMINVAIPYSNDARTNLSLTSISSAERYSKMLQECKPEVVYGGPGPWSFGTISTHYQAWCHSNGELHSGNVIGCLRRDFPACAIYRADGAYVFGPKPAVVDDLWPAGMSLEEIADYEEQQEAFAIEQWEQMLRDAPAPEPTQADWDAVDEAQIAAYEAEQNSEQVDAEDEIARMDAERADVEAYEASLETKEIK